MNRQKEIDVYLDYIKYVENNYPKIHQETMKEICKLRRD